MILDVIPHVIEGNRLATTPPIGSLPYVVYFIDQARRQLRSVTINDHSKASEMGTQVRE